MAQSCYVMGDIDRLYRAISNLITNAIQYTLADGIVTIRLDYLDNLAIITIQDTGIGIDLADLAHIFDRFYRVQGDRARISGGTGLGLAIVQAIVRSYHGTINVSSRVDQGSVFTVKFPAFIRRSRVS